MSYCQLSSPESRGASRPVRCSTRRRRLRHRGSAPARPGDACRCRWLPCGVAAGRRRSGADARDARIRCGGRRRRHRPALARRRARLAARFVRRRLGLPAGARTAWPVLATGSMISVSGGRACRDREGVGAARGFALRLADRLGRAAALRRRGGSSTSRLVDCVAAGQQRGRPWTVTAEPSPPPLGSLVGWCVAGRAPTCGHPEVPAGHPDEQHHRGGEEHQREAFDERIGAVDQCVFDVRELTAGEHEVGRRNGAEQQQRRLDDGGEDPGLPHRQHREDAADDIGAGKHERQRLWRPEPAS